MALQGSWNLKGQTVIQAYIRPTRLFGSKQEGINSVIGVFGSVEAALSGASPLEEFNGPVAPYIPDTDPLKLVYGALKAATVSQEVPDPDGEEGAMKTVQVPDPRFASLIDV